MTGVMDGGDGRPKVLEVGRILRAHGVRGDVVVRFSSERQERRAPGAVVTTPGGPLTVEAARHLSGDDWVVRYAEIADRTAAEALHGVPLSAEAIHDPDELWVHELLGAVVVDQDGIERGAVVEVHQGRASDLLVLDTGHLVPVTFVVAHRPGRLDVEAPDGLFDLL
ncbi:MAG: ribosome maturation factor RimM [Acidimicrobiales bacterium]